MAEKWDLSDYIPISRKIFDHEFWEEKRVFSKFEAWLDLVKTARYSDKPEILSSKNGDVEYGRGQIPASIRFLQKRWSWGSITRVENFLTSLKNKDMIRLEKRTGQFVITICKYDSYNPRKNEEGQQKDSNKDSKRTNKNKEIKNNILFDKFWDLYDKKVDRKECEAKWKNITQEQAEKIMDHVSKYKIAQPNSQYRKDPKSYLHNESWNNEIISAKTIQNSKDEQYQEHQKALLTSGV